MAPHSPNNNAEAVRRRFESWEANWRRCEQELPDFQLAFEWARKHVSDSWAGDLANHGYLLTRRVGRLTEAFEICERTGHLAKELSSSGLLLATLARESSGDSARVGRLHEALALYEKQEAICLDLGYKDGLQISYGNHAAILQMWGRQEEALTLLEKQEAVCLELGNKNGLQISYGNRSAARS